LIATVAAEADPGLGGARGCGAALETTGIAAVASDVTRFGKPVEKAHLGFLFLFTCM
jgi:hypothetical protein